MVDGKNESAMMDEKDRLSNLVFASACINFVFYDCLKCKAIDVFRFGVWRVDVLL